MRQALRCAVRLVASPMITERAVFARPNVMSSDTIKSNGAMHQAKMCKPTVHRARKKASCAAAELATRLKAEGLLFCFAPVKQTCLQAAWRASMYGDVNRGARETRK
ncbi:hypothetical protein IG631_15310 [Alternaria alternata]|nr:hypothetical protein IG631_15310 [Alternaria alternata]